MSASKAMNLDREIFLNDSENFESVTGGLVAGLSSPVRGRPELSGRPFWVSRGQGAYLWDLAGKKYIDLNAGHGASQLGHAHPAIEEALLQGIRMGVICGQETLLPGRVASRITKMLPCAELVRFMFTGTRATALAIKSMVEGKLGVKTIQEYHEKG